MSTDSGFSGFDLILVSQKSIYIHASFGNIHKICICTPFSEKIWWFYTWHKKQPMRGL